VNTSVFLRKIIILVILLVVSSSGLFAELTARLDLRVEVDPVMDISVSAEPVAQNLPAEKGTSAEGLLIGIVTEQSNNETGYTVTVVSDNLSRLANPENTHFILYTISYGTIEVDLTSGSALVIDTNSIQGTGEVTREIRISYVVEDIPPDVYADTLTFIMAVK